MKYNPRFDTRTPVEKTISALVYYSKQTKSSFNFGNYSATLFNLGEVEKCVVSIRQMMKEEKQ
jgi:hypothetical protein